MKKLAILLSAFIFTAFTVTAQISTANKKEVQPVQKKEVKQTKQTSNPNAPVIKFDKTTHDYGTIKQHGDGNCKFTFTNEGKEPLIITNVRSSCGCTIPTWPREPILPGQSKVIKVKYDTKRMGLINKTVHVYSNATTPSVTLRIKGKVVTKPNSAIPAKKATESAAPVDKKK